MKRITVLLTLLALCAWGAASSAGVPRDADGNRLIVDNSTARTPGAGAGLGAIVGAASDTLHAWEKHRFDLRVQVTAGGTSGDEASDTETIVSGVALFYRPNSIPWLRAGGEITWDAVDRGKVTVGIPLGFKLFPDPYSAVNWWFQADILPKFVVRTTALPEGVERKSAVTWAPGAGFLVEIPMGLWSVEGGLGAKFPFTIEGVSDQAANAAVEQLALGGSFAVNFRLGR